MVPYDVLSSEEQKEMQAMLVMLIKKEQEDISQRQTLNCEIGYHDSQISCHGKYGIVESCHVGVLRRGVSHV
jgi:hypothetical protein